MPLPSGFSQERVSMKTPTTLIIMDGFGLGPKYPGNAVENTPKPHLENIFKECPGCRLSASGLDVGLPEGQMGNSEVGHTNIGAGRVVFQDLPHISRDIDSGEFFKNPAYLAQVRDNDSIIFYNFRPDRAREITRCFVDEDFQDVERKKGFVPVDFVCTTEYDATMPNVTVAYPRQKLENIFGISASWG